LQQHIFSPQGSPFFMPNPFRRPVPAGTSLLVPALLLCLLSLTASQAIGQEAVPLTHFQKQMARIDFAFGAAGIMSSSVSGIEQRDANGITTVTPSGTKTTTAVTGPTFLTISPSSTLSELLTLHYTAKPLLGYEVNFGNFRYAQNYSFTNTTTTTVTNTATTPPTTTTATTTNNPDILQSVQAGVREFSFGYIAHPRKIYGVQPYLGAGIGTLRFKPTPGGGEGLPFQYRMAYYYNFGVEQNFTGSASHFGVRVGFRQLIYLEPDFLTNYLTITRRTRTSEPTFGFFLRF